MLVDDSDILTDIVHCSSILYRRPVKGCVCEIFKPSFYIQVVTDLRQCSCMHESKNSIWFVGHVDPGLPEFCAWESSCKASEFRMQTRLRYTTLKTEDTSSWGDLTQHYCWLLSQGVKLSEERIQVVLIDYLSFILFYSVYGYNSKY